MNDMEIITLLNEMVMICPLNEMMIIFVKEVMIIFVMMITLVNEFGDDHSLELDGDDISSE